MGTVKPYSFLVIATTLASDNLLRFKKNLIKRAYKLTMTFDDKIKDEKVKYDIDREAAKISAISSGKIDNINILQAKKYYHLIKAE